MAQTLVNTEQTENFFEIFYPGGRQKLGTQNHIRIWKMK